MLNIPAKQKAQWDRLAMLREVMRCGVGISDLLLLLVCLLGCVTSIKSWVFSANEGSMLKRGMFDCKVD